MGKSFRNRKNAAATRREAESVCIALDDIFVSESTWQKLLARDGEQIEAYRQAYENDEDMVRVVLRPRAGGGYNVEDGRHRVIAAKLAGTGFIEALIIGGNDDCD